MFVVSWSAPAPLVLLSVRGSVGSCTPVPIPAKSDALVTIASIASRSHACYLFITFFSAFAELPKSIYGLFSALTT